MAEPLSLCWGDVLCIDCEPRRRSTEVHVAIATLYGLLPGLTFLVRHHFAVVVADEGVGLQIPERPERTLARRVPVDRHAWPHLLLDEGVDGLVLSLHPFLLAEALGTKVQGTQSQLLRNALVESCVKRVTDIGRRRRHWRRDWRALWRRGGHVRTDGGKGWLCELDRGRAWRRRVLRLDSCLVDEALQVTDVGGC